MVKKLLILFFALVYFCQAQSALNKESYGEGFGNTRSEAIKNAINEALGKMEGLKQVKLKKFEFSFNGNFNIGYDEEIDLVSNGVFNSYDIKSLTQTNQNEFHAKVVIYKKLYSEKNLEDKSSLIIINKVKDELSAKFEQELLSVLLQSKKFRILDRANLDLYNQEKSLLIKNASDDELVKLYNVLGADFLLILNPKITQTQNEINTQTYNINIDYRLIEFATTQIKASNTLEFKMSSTSKSSKQKALRGIATKITEDIFKHSKDNDKEEEIEHGLDANYQINNEGGVNLGF
ncbi:MULTISPECIES: CsgG/HfaB family protein [Campylobacter]|uniref:CsgG/HfaB family protein n=1 Tax=Campylobacter TaxID=194 RepID=UPI00138E9591|nr:MULTISPECIES: CsgG/HfaB family protein [Campylobacter]EAJ6151938.1 hypothetical protein [Campylobacter lari]EAK5577361.1 hypothetical protein [Campylobacter lari]MCV3356248.1 hypothetical protein [Campylobacter sp. RKI_CA19_01122]MCV3424151.1 hypothetical protein [Campylobacter sp. IFREMER_LSEM_CL1085]MCV3433675.1 hypothetical protein [Campylobacter sp. IFREMER_LSEM_CL1846]